LNESKIQCESLKNGQLEGSLHYKELKGVETEEISSPLLKAIDLAGEIKTLTLKNAPEPDTVSVPSSILPETKPIAYLMKTSCLSPSVIYPLLT
jgi:hypothetical protein